MHEPSLSCTCGSTVFEANGAPIMSTECLCSDCQQAGALLARLPGIKPLLDAKGATRTEMYRKDRVRCLCGDEHLREHRLKPDSATRRVVATCCNTPMFLDFTKGHWIDLYGHLWPQGQLPPLEMRTMTRSKPAGVQLPDDVPNHSTHGVGFFARLLGAWLAMGLRTPRIDYVKGTLQAP